MTDHNYNYRLRLANRGSLDDLPLSLSRDSGPANYLLPEGNAGFHKSQFVAAYT
jgi:hypothetical protein